MKKYDEYILNNLINTYENSLSYVGNNTRNQSISFKFNKKNIKDYFDENTQKYHDINNLCKILEYKGYLKIYWKNNIENHIIEKVRLNIDKVNEIYILLKRKSKKVKEESVLKILEYNIGLHETMDNFIHTMIDRFKNNKSVK